MPISTAEVTVRVVKLFMEPKLAVIVTWPATKLVPKPLALMVATLALEEVQLTCVVKSCWLLSLKVPIAVNCCVVPAAMPGLEGLTVREVKVADVTVSEPEPFIDPTVAVMAVWPGATALATPFGAMVATCGFALHATELVMFC